MTRERATRPGEPGTWDRAAEQEWFDRYVRYASGHWTVSTLVIALKCARARWLSTRALEER